MPCSFGYFYDVNAVDRPGSVALCPMSWHNGPFSPILQFAIDGVEFGLPCTHQRRAVMSVV